MAAVPEPEPLDDVERRSFESALRDRIRDVVSQRPWVMASQVAQAAVGGAAAIRRAGATDVIAVATRVGVGELDPEIELVLLAEDDTSNPADVGVMAGIRQANHALHNPSRAVLERIDAFDPRRAARSIVAVVIDAGEVAGRATFGARPPSWAALDDKIAILDVWDAAGIETAPAAVVELADDAALDAAHRSLASDLGTIWAVDNELGWHGGASGTRWVRDGTQVDATRRELAAHHRRVRVQPFLEGVPCSVHGIVMPRRTIACRPCEMLVLRDREASALTYCRSATFWDPPAAARAEMRGAAVAVGEQLRVLVDFRGVFTMDGVMTADGFRPTEVNARYGAALPSPITSLDGEPISMYFVHLLAVEGLLDGIDADRLERWIVHALDEQRQGVALLLTPTAPDEERSVRVGDDGTALVEVDEHDPARVATVAWGPGMEGGGLCRAVFSDRVPIGASVAPTVSRVADFVDRRWALGLPRLEAPSDLR